MSAVKPLGTNPILIRQAYLYITKALKQYTPHVLGAMQIVASSYEPEELNRIGMSLYVSAAVRLLQ